MFRVWMHQDAWRGWAGPGRMDGLAARRWPRPSAAAGARRAALIAASAVILLPIVLLLMLAAAVAIVTFGAFMLAMQIAAWLDRLRSPGRSGRGDYNDGRRNVTVILPRD